jgi:hypothetical protein
MGEKQKIGISDQGDVQTQEDMRFICTEDMNVVRWARPSLKNREVTDLESPPC